MYRTFSVFNGRKIVISQPECSFSLHARLVYTGGAKEKRGENALSAHLRRFFCSDKGL